MYIKIVDLKKRRIITLISLLILQVNMAFSNVYYISNSGLDTNDGLSTTSSFKTLAKVNGLALTAGDQVLFKSGDSWTGYLSINGSGTAINPIVIGKYGGEVKPLIDGDGYQTTILIYNNDHIEINDLEVTNQANYLDNNNNPKKISELNGAENDWGTGRNVRFGLKLVGDNKSMTGFKMNNLYIHDIYPTPTNSDIKHQGYGIKFETQTDIDLTKLYKISNVIVENCLITELGHYGIWIKPDGLVSDLDKTLNHENYTFINNTFEETGGSGIVPNRTNTILVENCIFNHTGSGTDARKWNRGSGLWPFRCKDVVVQHNKFLNAHGPQDSYGAHIDFGNENVVLQYNYSFNNEGGFVEILGENLNCGYRYNISVNDGYRIDPNNDPKKKKGKLFWVSPFCGEASTGGGACASNDNFIYNNTVYVPNTLNPEILFMNNSGDTHFYNNLVYVQSGGNSLNVYVDTNNNTFNFQNNLFYQPSSFNFSTGTPIQINAVYDNPLLLSPGVIDNPDMYMLKNGSPGLNAGYLINGSNNPKEYTQHNGGVDYFGNPVSASTAPNIGAYNGSGEWPLSITDFSENKSLITVYPNPINNEAHVKLILNKKFRSKVARVEIYNVLGVLIYKKIFIASSFIELPSSTLNKGLNLIRVAIDGVIISKKVIK